MTTTATAKAPYRVTKREAVLYFDNLEDAVAAVDGWVGSVEALSSTGKTYQYPYRLPAGHPLRVADETWSAEREAAKAEDVEDTVETEDTPTAETTVEAPAPTRAALIARRDAQADATRQDRRLRDFGKSYPALNGDPVLQGHADWCAEHGHTKHVTLTENGIEVTSPWCPRCGETVMLEDGALVTAPTGHQSQESLTCACGIILHPGGEHTLECDCGLVWTPVHNLAHGQFTALRALRRN